MLNVYRTDAGVVLELTALTGAKSSFVKWKCSCKSRQVHRVSLSFFSEGETQTLKVFLFNNRCKIRFSASIVSGHFNFKGYA